MVPTITVYVILSSKDVRILNSNLSYFELIAQYILLTSKQLSCDCISTSRYVQPIRCTPVMYITLGDIWSQGVHTINLIDTLQLIMSCQHKGIHEITIYIYMCSMEIQ